MEIPMEQIVTQLIIMAVTAVAGGAWGWLKGQNAERKKKKDESNKERDEQRAMLRMVLFFLLKSNFDTFVVRGESITSAEKHEIEELYRFYHETLNGNSEGTRMYNEIMALKTD